jgi:hypothetical protein
MLRKFAVALLAATVFTAPVFAQGTPATATPPAKTETKSGTAAPTATQAATPAAPKVVTAKPTLKVAKAKTGHRFSGRHFARVKHVKHVTAMKSVRGVKHVRHLDRSKPMTDARGGAVMSAKPKSSTN